jgi:hypothetical protein
MPSSLAASPAAAPPARQPAWAGAGLALFALASAQAAFTAPYVILAPGERTNLFTTLLVCAPALWMALRLGRAGLSWRALGLWGLWGAGLAGSALASTAPGPALFRALALFLPAAAGLYCARALFAELRPATLFLHLCTLFFAAFTAAHLLFGAKPSFLGLHHHAVAGTIVLLSAGPIHLACTGSRPWRAAAALLLAAGYLVCFLAGSRFVVLLPFVLIPGFLLLRRAHLRLALAGLALSIALAAAFFSLYPDKTMRLVNYESTYYRVEAFPATWAIVKEHGLWGVGLRTPREPFLQDYEPVSSIVSKNAFMGTLGRNVTWDNQWLSLLTGVGVPVTLLYLVLLSALLARLFRRVRRRELPPGVEQGVDRKSVV